MSTDDSLDAWGDAFDRDGTDDPVPADAPPALLTPQPPRQESTGDVWLDVIALPGISDRLRADMETRRRFGIDKHGGPVQVDNGRDGAADAYQEILDGIVYSERERQRLARLSGSVAMFAAERWTWHREILIGLAETMLWTINYQGGLK